MPGEAEDGEEGGGSWVGEEERPGLGLGAW